MSPERPDRTARRQLHAISASITFGLIFLFAAVVTLLAMFNKGTRDFLHRLVTSPGALITVAPMLILLMAALYYLVTRPAGKTPK